MGIFASSEVGNFAGSRLSIGNFATFWPTLSRFAKVCQNVTPKKTTDFKPQTSYQSKVFSLKRILNLNQVLVFPHPHGLGLSVVRVVGRGVKGDF